MRCFLVQYAQGLTGGCSDVKHCIENIPSYLKERPTLRAGHTLIFRLRQWEHAMIVRRRLTAKDLEGFFRGLLVEGVVEDIFESCCLARLLIQRLEGAFHSLVVMWT